MRRLAALDVEPDRVAVAGSEVFVLHPNGAGQARLTGAQLERTIGCPGDEPQLADGREARRADGLLMRFAVVGHTGVGASSHASTAMPAAGQIVHSMRRLGRQAAGGGPSRPSSWRALGADVEFHTGARRRRARAARGGAASARKAPDLPDPVAQRADPPRVHPRRRGRRADDHRARREAAPARPAATSPHDGCFFVAGDAAALRCAREARFLAATARELATDRESGRQARPARRQRERPGRADRRAALQAAHVVVDRRRRTGGSADGRPVRAPRRRRDPLADAYGCGDSFAAALAFALGARRRAGRRARARDPRRRGRPHRPRAVRGASSRLTRAGAQCRSAAVSASSRLRCAAHS